MFSISWLIFCNISFKFVNSHALWGKIISYGIVFCSFEHKSTFLMWKMILKKYTFTQRYKEKMVASIDAINNLLIKIKSEPKIEL